MFQLAVQVIGKINVDRALPVGFPLSLAILFFLLSLSQLFTSKLSQSNFILSRLFSVFFHASQVVAPVEIRSVKTHS